jgi:WhiB family redox-sensing transcriptional regulator
VTGDLEERLQIELLMAPGVNAPDDVLAELIGRPSWQDRAACRGQGTDDHFPVRGESTIAAKAVCAGCVVRSECLSYALADSNLVGIWGGTSERERRQMRQDAKLRQRESGVLAG